MQKISSFHQFILEMQSYSPMTRLATPIFDHAHSKIFDQLLVYVNCCQNGKYQAISLICSADMVD